MESSSPEDGDIRGNQKERCCAEQDEVITAHTEILQGAAFVTKHPSVWHRVKEKGLLFS